MKKLLFIMAMVCLHGVTLPAQVVSWGVKPGLYSDIEPYWEDMYKVRDSDFVGIIHGNGKIIVPTEANRITGFYEDLALVLKSDGEKEQVLGCLTKNGVYTKFSGKYYTIPYQEFFSEGLLTVINAHGQAGFVNENGVIAKLFKDNFVSPFSEGYAVVGEEEKVRIIDKRFKEVGFLIDSNYDVDFISNAYRGASIICTQNDEYYSLDVKSSNVAKRINNNKKPQSLNVDYMYRLSCITGCDEHIPYDQPKRFAQTLAATRQQNKYGYVKDGKEVLPCQLDDAENFYGSYAIVKANGKYGLLTLHNDADNFHVLAADSVIKYKSSAGKELSHKFGITVPSLWNVGDLLVRITDPNGQAIDATGNGETFEFRRDAATDTQQYNVEFACEGLKLWAGKIQYRYEKEADVIVINDNGDDNTNITPPVVTLKIENEDADKEDHCHVKATISNPNGQAITVMVHITGSEHLAAVSQRVTIPANGSKEVNTYFTVTTAIKGQKVTASTSAGGSDTLEGLQFLPFDF